MLEYIEPTTQWIGSNWPLLAGGAAAGWGVGYYGSQLTIRSGKRWANNGKKHVGTRRFLAPKTWFDLQPKHLFELQEKLLMSPDVREFYAPASQFIIDMQPKRVYLRNGWTSPYRKAVMTSVADHKAEVKGKRKHLMAVQQIKQVAKWARVLPLTEDIFIGGDPTQHFLVELGLARHSKGQVRSLRDAVEGAFDAESIEEVPAGTYDRIRFVVHLAEPEDILVDRKFGVEFFIENPAKTPYSLPLAMTEDGKVWSLDMHHLLIYGMTGAGKGGPIQGIIRQLAPFVKKGSVKLYGIDPKGPELGAYAKKGVRMFDRISIGLAEENIRQHVSTINQIAAIIADRGNNLDPDFREGQEDLKRDFPATRETPWVVLIIDEYLTLVKGLKKLGKEGAPALATLDQILATGRSFGVYVVMATQVATKEVFGDVRDNIPNAIVLKHKASDYWTQEFLGDDIPGTRFDPKRIGPSSKANGYKTAGIASVATAEGVKRVRFGYLSDTDIIAVAKQFMDEDADMSVFKQKDPIFKPEDYGLAITQEEAEAFDGLTAQEIIEHADDGGFTFEPID